MGSELLVQGKTKSIIVFVMGLLLAPTTVYSQINFNGLTDLLSANKEIAVYKIIQSVPVSLNEENDAIVKWALSDEKNMNALVLHDISRRVFLKDKHDGMKWAFAAQFLKSYDRARCKVKSARNGSNLLGSVAREILRYMDENLDERLLAIEALMEWERSYTSHNYPIWACHQGVGNNQSKSGDNPIDHTSLVLPKKDWPKIRYDLQKKWADIITAKKKSGYYKKVRKITKEENEERRKRVEAQMASSLNAYNKSLSSHKENDAIINWALANEKRINAMILFDVSRRKFVTNKHEGMKLFFGARMWVAYDGARCVDKSAANGLSMLAARAQEIIKYLSEHPNEKLAALEDALEWEKSHPSPASPIWVCQRGMSSYQAKIEGKTIDPTDMILPKKDWPKIRSDLQKKWGDQIMKSRANSRFENVGKKTKQDEARN